jgi:aspartate ammonia-lyase
MQYRTEKDFLGEMNVPADALWGIHTERARHNFRVAGYAIKPALVRALAACKRASCVTNKELGYLDAQKADAIIDACDDILAGKFIDQFPVDALAGGAGTSANMNINEVIANRASELLGGKKGEYTLVHPLDHVNLHQSTNDVFPTAVKVAAILGLRRLSGSVEALQGAFQKKEKEFAAVTTVARTELQEAVPITLGAEFSAFSEAIGRDRWRTFKCEERLRVVNLGGTAVGTGITAPRDYIFLVVEKLREVAGLGLARAENLVDQTANADAFVEVSGILKAHAANLLKISNDLRLLNFTGEILLEKLQAGSSIMPGKVNPVILEAVMQGALKVMANDSTIAEACSRGTFQICEFMPLLADALIDSVDLLCNCNDMLARHVSSIEARPDKCRDYFEKSPMIITAFLPHIGYDRSCTLLKEFTDSGQDNVKTFLVSKLGSDLVEEVLSPYKLMALGYRKDKN